MFYLDALLPLITKNYTNVSNNIDNILLMSSENHEPWRNMTENITSNSMRSPTVGWNW